jgi:hypothetical protein
MTKIAGSGSRIRIRIHLSEAWIRGSGSTPKCHGSGTLLKSWLTFSNFLIQLLLDTYLHLEILKNRIRIQESLISADPHPNNEMLNWIINLIISLGSRLRTMRGGRARRWRRLSAGWEPTWPMSLTRSSAHKWPAKPAGAKSGAAVQPSEALTLYSQLSLINDKASRKNTNGGKSRTNPRILS